MEYGFIALLCAWLAMTLTLCISVIIGTGIALHEMSNVAGAWLKSQQTKHTSFKGVDTGAAYDASTLKGKLPPLPPTDPAFWPEDEALWPDGDPNMKDGLGNPIRPGGTMANATYEQLHPNKVPALCQVLTAWVPRDRDEDEHEFLVGIFDDITLAQVARESHTLNNDEKYLYGIEPWVIEGRYE
jgi:hypothetical protein